MRELVFAVSFAGMRSASEKYKRGSVKCIEVTTRERLEIREEPRRLYKKKTYTYVAFFKEATAFGLSHPNVATVHR